MNFFYILLGLVATAAAVDIRFTNSQTCNGWYAACANINPGVCCSLNTATMAIEYAAVPNTWFLRKSGYTEENCNHLISEIVSFGSLCDFNLAGYKSGRYVFSGMKLARSPSDDTTSEDCQRVDTFVLEDGSKYTISDLSDSQVDYLV